MWWLSEAHSQMSGEIGPQFWEGGTSRLCLAAGCPRGTRSLIFYYSCNLIFPDSDSSRFFSKPSLRSRNTIFTLGTRGSVISPTELEAPILVPHTAQRGEQRVGGGTNLSPEGGAEHGWVQGLEGRSELPTLQAPLLIPQNLGMAYSSLTSVL